MNHFTPTLSLTLAVTLAIGSTLLHAQDANPPPRGPQPFSAFDQDGNGLISQQEFETAHAQRMAAAAAAGMPMRGAANPPAFADFDLNSDGQLTPDELAQGQEARRRGPGMGPGMGPGPGMGMGPGMGPGMGRTMPAFTDFDLDGDGTLTEQEFTQARSQRIQERARQGYPMRNLPNAPAFATIDTNADGLVDPQEFSAAQAQHRQQGMPPR